MENEDIFAEVIPDIKNKEVVNEDDVVVAEDDAVVLEAAAGPMLPPHLMTAAR